jgi:hypothetical protein
MQSYFDLASLTLFASEGMKNLSPLLVLGVDAAEGTYHALEAYLLRPCLVGVGSVGPSPPVAKHSCSLLELVPCSQCLIVPVSGGSHILAG